MREKNIFLLNQMLQNTQIKLKDAGNKQCDASWACVDSHFPYDSIGYIKEGKIRMTINGKTELIGEGGMYYLPAMCCFSHCVEGETARVYWTHFELGASSDKPVLHQIEFPVYVKIPEPERTERIFEELFEYPAPVSLGYPLKYTGLMYQLTAQFFELCQEKAQMHSSETSELMKQAAEYICAHLDQNLTVKDLAGQAGLNPRYFIKVFQETFQETPIRFMLNQRDQRARNLLEHSDMSVKEISYSLGFSNQNYFSVFFKKRSGYSPSEYRRLKR